MESKTARSIMRNETVFLSPEMTLDKVSDHLTLHTIPGAPVVNKSEQLVGYVSEYDCLQHLTKSSYFGSNAALVEDVMTTKLIFESPDIGLINLASRMNEDRINVMPMVDNNKLIGAVIRGDVMRALVAQMGKQSVQV